jgi:hypothetical protein
MLCAGASFAGECLPHIGGQVPNDTCALYDTDCDSISAAVEIDLSNRTLYQFDTTRVDLNPSVAHGFPGNGTQQGTLEGGLNLPDVPGIYAVGYYHYYQQQDVLDSNDWGTLSLLNTLEGTGRLWIQFPRANCLIYDEPERPPRFGVGDLSKRGGGLWPSIANPGTNRHDSHQNGLDADVRFLRISDAQTPLDLRTADSLDYDLYSTVDLMRCFVRVARDRVIAIFVDTVLAKIQNEPGQTVVIHDTGHYNHFHVRIIDPDGISN